MSLQITEVSDFTGGLNFRADQFQLQTYESPEMRNVEVDPRGGVFSRGAMRRLNTTAVSGTWAPERLFAYQAPTPYVLLTNNDKVFKSSGGNFSVLQWDNAGVPTDVASVTGHGACIQQWGDVVYMAVGAAGNGGYYWKYSDTYATPLTASGTAPHAWQTTPTASERKMPTAEHLMVHANKMFAAYTTEAGTTYPNRIRWSLENSPENWAEADYIDIGGGGNGITGMAVVASQLVIFKPNAVYVLLGYDSDNFQVAELTSRIGVLDHNAIAQSDDGVYFYSHSQGLFYYNGSSLRDMFASLRPAIESGYINPAAHDAISCSWVGRRVWVSAPYSRSTTVTDPTVNWVLDPSIRDGVFVEFASADGYGLIGGVDWTNGSNNDYRLMIHPTQPYVLRVDLYSSPYDNITGSDVGFPSYYKTRWFDGGSYMQNKMFRRPDIVAKESDVTQAITVKVYHNFSEGENNEKKIFDIVQTPAGAGLFWGTGNWGENWAAGAVSSVLLTGRNLGQAKSVQLEFIGPSGQKWGLNSIGYKYNTRRVTG